MCESFIADSAAGYWYSSQWQRRSCSPTSAGVQRSASGKPPGDRGSEYEWIVLFKE